MSPEKFNFSIWQRAVERVIAAHDVRIRTVIDTPEGEAADAEYREAVVAYRVVAGRF
jgi:hypothetical protein